MEFQDDAQKSKIPPLYLGNRWTAEEISRMNELKRRSWHIMKDQIPYPEVVGERRLIRFIRSNWDDSFDAIGKSDC